MMVNAKVNNQPTASVSEPTELLEQIDRWLDEVADKPADQNCETIDSTPAELLNSLGQLRELLSQKDAELDRLTRQSDSLAAAQAEAIVRSAEIIDELEQTKKQLSDARSAAEQSANDTKRLADTIFERTSDSVLVFDRQGCSACNDNATEMFGIKRSAMLRSGCDFFRTLKLEDGSDASSTLKSSIRQTDQVNSQRFEAQVTRHDGTSFWAEFTFSPFVISGGDQVLAIVRDITARKQFEAELRRHRDFLNRIVSAVPDQLSVRASDHRIVVANRAFLNAHGVTEEDIVGKLPDQIDVPCLREFDPQIDACFAGDVPQSTCVDSWVDDEGNQHYSAKRYSAFTDESTSDRFVIATSRDITDDRQREHRLRLLASVFEESAEGVAILDTAGKILEANPAFARMTNIGTGNAVIGQRFADLIHVEADSVLRHVAEAANGQSWSGKIRLASESEVSEHMQRTFWVSLSPSDGNVDRQIIALTSDITELENSQAQLHHRAMHDSLTGCPNRAFFREMIVNLVNRKASNASQSNAFSICFLDLDDFKHVNDSVGHAGGDQLLQFVADRIIEVVGGDAFVARFGGDEFAILFRDAHYDLATQQNLLSALIDEFNRPFALTESEAHVGLSIGVTRFPKDSSDTETLMSYADTAMYAAKQSGKNAVAFFEPSMQYQVDMRQQVQTKLRGAINNGDVELYFQPKVRASTRELVSCEALIRWRDSEGQFVPPNTFIPIAENSGLINALGEYVFETAAKQARIWHDQGNPLRIAVNVSPIQLRSADYAQSLVRILERTGAKAEWLELEITENAIMSNVEYSTMVIEKLSEAGFRIAIDDFGTGHSSLSYLKTFNVHTLKIDLSFIRDVIHDRFSRSIVQSIISLGRGLGLTVVAEGVEVIEQVEYLAKLRCDELQGYYFGRPMPAQEFEIWRSKYTPMKAEDNAATPVRCFDW
ncbi:EAL domain-containing protein [Stieleria sp. JC731]|uniref:sensor domain-containing protein n=1 Tax=Pirellulaceae TaxID=2691357 RepID=UPI001E2A7A95|nr:EAL domain-containing protein [Stieleria sp. JC731]MCC9601262.1 EAL domain-containing protein [Stieleria sp. JC731]